MTTETLQTVVKHIKNPSFVPPISDFQLGRLMFRASRSIEECTTDEMANGWVSAAGDDAGLVRVAVMQ